MVGIIYAGILLDRARKVTEGLIDDERGGFRAGRGYVNQIFTLQQVGEKHERKKVEYVWVLLTLRKHMIGLIWKPYGRY